MAAVASQMTPPARTQLVHAPDSPMVELFRTCSRIAASEATVLITGETGTGKEVVARLIHARSPRAGKPLIPVNCGAIPETLLESELFGYVKGAFTGAVGNRRGRVAAADGGTLFLDEIGELPLSLQVKLLRVLQERSYEPVGSAESVPANFRLVAATNRDLAAEVEAGRFRRDLYYRLLVCPVEVLPLRDRRGDVPHLFAHFWSLRGETRSIDPAVPQVLRDYGWPGNVRELENLVERLAVCSEGPSIRLADLPNHLRPAGSLPAASARRDPPPLEEVGASEEIRRVFCARDEVPVAALTANTPSLESGPVDLPAMLRRIEDSYIEAALAKTGGNKKAAADLLSLQRTTLVEKLRRRNRDASTA